MGEESYAHKSVLVSASVDISGANNVVVGPPGMPFEVSQLRLNVGVATSGATPAVVTVTKRITPGSDSGAITLGSFSVPAGYSVGDEILINMGKTPNIDLNSGEQLKFTSDGNSDGGTIYIAVIGNYVNPGPSPAKSFAETSRKVFENGNGTYNYLPFTNA